MTIDPRLAERRVEVAEDRARRNVRRLLRFLLAIALVGSVVWLFLSPTLSARSVDVAGVGSSEARQILVDHQVVPGRPLILIRSDAVENALLMDPWVKEAAVHVDWPDLVRVEVVERTPIAWVETSEGWTRRAVDSVVLPGPDTPDASMGQVRLASFDDRTVLDAPELAASLIFLDELPVSLSSGAVIDIREGELWAVVAGYLVRLGRPIEMEEKALSLAALLEQDLPVGSVINMIAPVNPAVIPPQEPEVPGDDGGGEESSGEEGATTTQP